MIETFELTKRFGTVTAVDRLNLRVRPGRVTGFLGPNGAGKSTTIRMIIGLDTPSNGRATVNGRPYRSLDQPLREVGVLLDASATHGGLRAHQHLDWLAASNGLARTRIGQVLDMTGLESVARRRIRGLSLGMRQRLGIAAALLGDPGVLILDEPVNGLDPDGIAWIRGLLRSLAAQGRTVLISSHLMSEMALTADHLVVIGRGRLLADAPVAELLHAAGPAEVVVATAQPEQLAVALHTRAITVRRENDSLVVTGLTTKDVGSIAAEAGATVYGLTCREPSLEQAYLRLTEHATQLRTERAPR